MPLKLLSMLLLLSVCVAATAQSPTTAPTTKIAVVPIDRTTPRGALKVLTQALDSGDAAVIRETLLSESEPQRQWAEAMTALAGATGGLRRQAETTFGAEGARAMLGDTQQAMSMEMVQIDTFTEELESNGTVATVRPSFTDERPMTVKRVDGAWRVTISTFTGDADNDALTTASTRLQKQADAIRAVTTEIADGKLTTPEHASQALQRRQMEAVLEKPATAPTG
jgi:hypothetical protein